MFSDIFSRNPQLSSLVKICPVGDGFFSIRSDGRTTDRNDEAYRDFPKAPTKSPKCESPCCVLLTQRC
jgi:hypothetical protein